MDHSCYIAILLRDSRACIRICRSVVAETRGYATTQREGGLRWRLTRKCITCKYNYISIISIAMFSNILVLRRRAEIRASSPLGSLACAPAPRPAARFWDLTQSQASLGLRG